MSYGSLHVQPVGASAYSFPIDTPVVRIGRDPAHNDLVISDGGISRRHVQIELRQTDGGSVQATVKDLGSANGTTLDGARRCSSHDVCCVERMDVRRMCAVRVCAAARGAEP